MGKRHRFVLLDGLRGLAALAVIQFHTYTIWGRKLFPHGYLAVDFFFLLSGFVLTYTYQERLDHGWSTRSFLRARWVRLYPLYLLGTVLGLVLLEAMRHVGHQPHRPSPPLFEVTVLSLFMLPAAGIFGVVGFERPYPADYPAWSLFSEAIANIVHALILRRRSMQFLCCTLAFSGVLLLVGAGLWKTLDIGAERSNFLWSIPRVLFFYVLGMILFRLWQFKNLRLRLPVWVSVVASLVILALPEQHASWNGLLDCLLAMTCWPCVLLAAASVEPSSRFGTGLAHISGALSYAAYVLHAPLRGFFGQFWLHLTHHLPESPRGRGPLPTVVFVLMVVLFSYLADRFFDNPVRSWLALLGAGKRNRSGAGSPSEASRA